MALIRVCIASALLLLLSTAACVRADGEDDEGVTVEPEEEEHYQSPTVDPKKVYLAEHFDDKGAFKKRWIKSEAKKQDVDEDLAKYDGVWEIQEPTKKILKNDFGLVLTTEAKHAAISTLLDRPFVFQDKPLVVQYEVTMQEGQNCGGAYLKLLSRGVNSIAELRKFHDQTPYTIMFGPDKCGNDHKLHFIFRHVNPRNQSIEEKHCKKPKQRLDDIYKDKEPHLYTLIVRPDNTFTVFIDQKEMNSGSLLEDFTPPVNPPEEIDDPDDKKPADWDEREQIVDPEAEKPDDWDEDAPAKILDPNAVKPDGWLDDEPELIPNPDAKKPDDWDEEMDSEWEAPLIDNPVCAVAPGCGPWSQPLMPNPAFKGPWRAPLIPNPNYKGKWTPRRIPNPHFFRDDTPFKMTPIHAVGFELWSMSPRLLFDNLLITDDLTVAEDWAEQTFALKRAKIARDSRTWSARVSKALNDRPGWWLAYACYCAIPISLYVAYLIRRAREDSVVDRGLKFAGEHPWVWAVLIFGLVVVVGSIAYCCVGSKSDSSLDPKKTDAYAPDDQPEPSDGEGEGAGAGEDDRDGESAREAAEAPPPRRGKAQLEPEPADDDEQPEPVSTTNASTSTDVDGSGDHQKRRRPRKE